MKKLFSLLTAILFVGSMWATSEISTLTFTAKCNGSGTADDGATWTVTSDASESDFDNTRGIHYGTSSAEVSYLTLTTTSIQGEITEIVVNAAGASKTTAKLNVKVGGAAFDSEESLTSSAANYTFSGSASGTIEVKLTQSSAKKGLYVNSIKVTYTPADCTNPATALSITNENYTTLETPLTLTTSGGNGGTVTWSVVAGTGSATIEGNTLTPVSKGTVIVTATQAENTVSSTTYCGAAPTQTVYIRKPEPDAIEGGTVDELTISTFGVSGTGAYTAFTNKGASNTGHSSAKYAGTVARNGSESPYNIQLNNGSTSGKYREIVSTSSALFAKRVYVKWATKSDNSAGRTVSVYGSNTAYTGSETGVSGTKIGDIVYAIGDLFEYLDINADYKYIQIVSASGVIYMDQINITWVVPTYAITFNATPGNGTLTIYDEDTNPISTGNKFEEGAQFIVETEPASGYKLNTLTVVETDDPTNDVTSTVLENGILTLPAYGITVAATFSVTTALEDVETSVKAVKVLRNGVLYIEKAGKTYNAQGQLVK